MKQERMEELINNFIEHLIECNSNIEDTLLTLKNGIGMKEEEWKELGWNLTPDKEVADLVLEREELLECDIKTGNIKVDKQIFDDFVPNTYINIQFVEDEDEGIWQFSMVAEDDEGIFMEYFDYIKEE